MLLRFCILITLFMGAVSQYNYRYFCPNTSTNTPTNSTYRTNVKSLLSALSSNGNGENGFYNSTAGGDRDTVYGMFMCRGDVSSGDCATCVNQACSDILRLNMSAMERNSELGFMQRVVKTSEEMTRRVAAAGDKFGTYEANFSKSERVYSLGQCTPDISELDCQTCLKTAVQLLSTCCDSALGARVLSPSCNVRYELYLFYNPKVQRTPVVDDASNSRNSFPKVIVAIVVPVIGIIFFIIVGLCFVRLRNVKKRNITTKTTDVTGVSAEEYSQYDFATIQAITNDFSAKSKIGQGGYGSVYKAWEHWRDDCPMKILDPTLGESYTENEVIPCMHIGLLCVQDNADERPTMTKVMLMLNSYFANSWPTPHEPAFYRSISKRIPKEVELALSITVNEVSISELCPR
nr:cysteine-rich receptor-like protein kinase 25 [Ipomoea batatas]